MSIDTDITVTTDTTDRPSLETIGDPATAHTAVGRR
jgi:hypothetical protein